MLINSIHNPKIKNIRALKTKKGRKEFGQFFIEGVNIIKDINPNKVELIQLFIKQSAYEKLQFLEKKLNTVAIQVEDTVFNRLCDTKTPSGAFAVANIPKNKPISGDTIILLDNIADAGNMGTILRTATAKGVETVLLFGDCVDVFSPKVVRASMGGIFYINAQKIGTKELDLLIENYALVGLDSNGESIYQFAKDRKTILAVGNEAHGLSPNIKQRCNKIISLPMSNNIESLNAAISISIALFMI